VHLVGFITKKYVTMHGHINVKNAYMSSSSEFYLIAGLLFYDIYDSSVALPFAFAQQYIRNIRSPSCWRFLSD